MSHTGENGKATIFEMQRRVMDRNVNQGRMGDPGPNKKTIEGAYLSDFSRGEA